MALLILLAVPEHACSEVPGARVARDLHLQLPRIGELCAREMLTAARRALIADQAAPIEAEALPSCPVAADERELLLSLGRPAATAYVARARGGEPATALTAAVGDLRSRASLADRRDGGLKLDVLGARVGSLFGSEARVAIDRTLHGIYLPGADLVLLPEELTARRLVDSKGRLKTARMREYLGESGRLPPGDFGELAPGAPYGRLDFDSYYLPAGGDDVVRLYRGNRLEPEISPAALLAAARLGGDYLVRHLRADGEFDYRYQAKWDEVDSGYNLLRHAGTAYSLFELYAETGDERYLAAGSRALEWLEQHFREPKPEHAETGFLSVMSHDEEAKLGGAALATLAMLRYQQATGDERWLPTMRRLALFMRFMQDDEGQFESKYFYGPPDPEPFVSIYYPGEAVLALARLSRVDPEGPWLETSMDGAGWLMGVRDLGKTMDQLPHDHWLLMGLEELYDLSDEGRTFYLHGRRIAAGILRAQRERAHYPDWVGTYYTPPRSTPTATRSEALVAMTRMARRTGDDDRPYLEALRRAAGFQLRTQLAEESLLYLPRPDLARGGFRRDLDNWEVRIDYVQHNLSALLGLRALLLSDVSLPPSKPTPSTAPAKPSSTAPSTLSGEPDGR